MRKTGALIFLGLAVAASTSMAGEVTQQYNNPLLDELWVDDCVMRFGAIDCSEFARGEAATAWCRLQGGYDWAEWTHESPDGDHTTMRLTHEISHGQSFTSFQSCSPCASHFSRIDCRFHVR